MPSQRSSPGLGPAGLLLIAIALTPAACGTSGIKMEGNVAMATGNDFFEFPEKYKGKLVRLDNLEMARLEIGRPLVFLTLGEGERHELVVGDARSLARVDKLQKGQIVSVVIDCGEGRTDRGNLLIAFEGLPQKLVPGEPGETDPLLSPLPRPQASPQERTSTPWQP